MWNQLKLAIKDLKKMEWMAMLCIFFFSLITLSTVSMVSAVEVKIKEYRLVKPYLQNRGVLLLPAFLAKDSNNHGTFLRDEQELKTYLNGVEEIVCYEKIWEPQIVGLADEIEAYCYNSNAIRCMEPVMKEGRWFGKEDINASVLSAVITGNTKKEIHVGDVLTLKTAMDKDLEIQIKVVGVLDDRNALFFNDIYRKAYGDYRDCYYVFQNDAEDRVKLFLSDEQILAGEKEGMFEYLNYRLSPTKGFQKEMTGISIISFQKNMTEEEIDAELGKLYEMSYLHHKFNLRDFYKNSRRYVMEDLIVWLPLVICVSVFILITVISVNTIMIKKQLGNYAIYYLCGLSWKDCAGLSFTATGLECIFSFLLTTATLCVLKLTGLLKNSALHLGFVQLFAILIVLFLFAVLSHILPGLLVYKTSAKEVLAENKV